MMCLRFNNHWTVWHTLPS